MSCNQIEPKSLTLGEVLDGDRMAMSLYELHFRGLQTLLTLCRIIALRRFFEFVFIVLFILMNQVSHGTAPKCLSELCD